MPENTPETISAGKVVGLHYTLTDNDGAQIDSSRERAPLPYLHGHRNIVPGLEKAMEGRQVGECFQVKVAPAEGYGERHPDGLRTVPRDAFPAEMEIGVGRQYAMQGPSGTPIPFWVQELGETEVVIDLNNPLAGVDLNFDVEVVSLRDATPKELEQGHPDLVQP